MELLSFHETVHQAHILRLFAASNTLLQANRKPQWLTNSSKASDSSWQLAPLLSPLPSLHTLPGTFRRSSASHPYTCQKRPTLGAANLAVCLGPVIGGLVVLGSGSYEWVFWALVVFGEACLFLLDLDLQRRRGVLSGMAM